MKIPLSSIMMVIVLSMTQFTHGSIGKLETVSLSTSPPNAIIQSLPTAAIIDSPRLVKAQPTLAIKDTAFATDVVIVGLKHGITIQSIVHAIPAKHTFNVSSASLDFVMKSLSVASAEPLFIQDRISLGSQYANKQDTALTRIYRLHLIGSTDVTTAVSLFSQQPDVEFAEPDYVAHAIAIPHVSAAIPNDPLYPSQWGLNQINATAAWDVVTGTPSVVIAVIDSGIDMSHPDLVGQVWTNPGDPTVNSTDDDGNALVDDVNGWNFVDNNNDISDSNGHGTQVAGVIAAATNNVTGIAGLCWQCRIMPVKVMADSGIANYSDIAAGINYAMMKGARVINLSVGGYADSNALRTAIAAAVAQGIVVVGGAGNDNVTAPFYPAAYPNVLAVAATTITDTKAVFSNYGSWVNVSAPGADITTTFLGGDYGSASGTSMAAPFVSGLAGLLRTLHPDWNQSTVRSQIVHTTDSIESMNATYSGMLGIGRLNAGNTVQSPHPLITITSFSVNGMLNGRPLLSTTTQLSITLTNDWWNAIGVAATLSTTDTTVIINNAHVIYGDISAATSKANTTTFTFSVDISAGYNHPIPFTLGITDTTGYTNTIPFKVNTETGVETKSGTLTTQTWTSDKTYLINNNISIPAGNTLTIQPGTVIKFNGNYSLSVRGTLIADGTASQPIQFKSNSAGTWNKIFFDDLNVDAQADDSGNYLSGSIMRYVSIEGNTGGIACTSATPYLSRVNLTNGGITCVLGDTPMWLLDNTIIGNASFTGIGHAYRNTIRGELIIGSGSALSNIVRNGRLVVGGTSGRIEQNTVYGGNVSAGSFFQVLSNTIWGSLSVGSNATVDHNIASSGITVGSSVTVTWNSVENATATGLTAGTNVTAQYNRLVGNVTGMKATSGLLEHNLIANNSVVGLQVGVATVRHNTFTGNKGNTILVQGGTPLAIEYNNFEGNVGTYDLYLNIPDGVSVSAQNNWWGTTDDLIIADRIYDWNDDDTKATALYTAIETTPILTTPGYVRSMSVLPDTTLGIQTGSFEVHFSKPMDTNDTPSMSFYNNMRGTWNHYATSSSGLPNSTIFAIAIEANGTKWIGTEGGVASFNGITWTVYNNTNSGLPDSYVMDIAIEPNGTKWFGTRSGVASFNGTIWKVYDSSNSGLPNNYVSTIAVEPNGTKWIGFGYGVVSFDGTHWTVYNSSNTEYLNNYVHKIDIDANGTKWFSSVGGGAASYDGTQWTVYSTENSGLPSRNVHTVAFEPGGITWIGTELGPARFDGIQWTIYNTTNSDLPNNYVRDIAIEANGTKWFATVDGIASFDGLHWKSYNTSNSDLSSNYFYAVAIESDGTKWFGSSDGGIGVLYGAADYPIVDNQKWTFTGIFSATYDISTIIPKATYRIAISSAFDSDGMRIAPFSNTTFTVAYAGAINDITPSPPPTVTASQCQISTISASASWIAKDPNSPITAYRYALGSTPESTDVLNWITTGITSTTRTGLSLTAGTRYYFSVKARNQGGMWSKAGYVGFTAGVACRKIYVPITRR
jgi:subtilisin family serine protease